MDDWHLLTSSLGRTGLRSPFLPPSNSFERLESTSLAFILVEVPEPVWKTSRTNSSSHFPSATSRAAPRMASANSGLTCPRSLFTCAAAPLMSPRARMKRRGKRIPEMGKFSTARWVCAP